MSDEETFDTTFFILKNIIEELLVDGSHCFITEIDGQMVGLLNCSADSDSIFQTLTDANNFIEQNFGFTFYSYISSSVQSYTQIPLLYDKTAKDFQYSSINNHVTLYSNFMKQNDIPLLFEVSDNIIGHFITAILKGDMIGVQGSVKQIWTLLSNTSSDLTQLLIQHFTTDLITKLYTERKLITNLKDINLLINFSDIDNFFINLNQFIENIMLHLKENSTSNENEPQIISDIMKYIQKNYSNESLNVATVGEEFSLTPYYLSSNFKKNTGLSILDYIQKVRIEQAKYLLQTTEYSLNTIASKIGYNNVKTFMRTFVKCESETPGRYKERNGIT